MRLRLVPSLLCLAAATTPLGAQARGDDAAAPDGAAPAAVAADAAPIAPARVVSSSAAALAFRDSLVALARAQIGRRYRYGEETPERGFDCSGLVQYVLGILDVRVPRTAAQQARIGLELVRDTAQLRPGDLLTFGRGRRVEHIAIYVGDGRMVHASSGARRVVETPVIRPARGRIRPWRSVRRLVFPADRAAAAERALGADAARRATRGAL